MAWLPEYRQASLFWYASVILAASGVFANEYDVYKAIIADYDKNVRPAQNFSASIVVSVELTFFVLLTMDPKQETITFQTEVELIWKDENIRWNASEFGDTSSILIPSELLWKPDIIVTTGLEVKEMMPDKQRVVNVLSDGTVRSSSPIVITNQCRMSIEAFPYDEQKCLLTLGSWMYTTDQIDLYIGHKLRNLDTSISEDTFKGSGEWLLVSFQATVDYSYGEGKRYTEVTYRIGLQRQPIYYICVLLVPVFMTATVCLVGLFVPAMNTGERVEKMNMGMATLLSMGVFLGIVAGEMPKSTTLPVLGFYVLAELLLCTIGIIVSMVIMVAHQRASTRALIPPRWLNTILFLNTRTIQKPKKRDVTTVYTKKIIRPLRKDIKDQPAETLSFMTEVILSWYDEIVKWNKTAYANIESVVIPASLLWKPDIIVTTSLETDYRMPEQERFVTVSGDGTVQSASPCIITNQCVLDIQKFPYDVQECNITFGSWMYDSTKIDLKIGNYSEDEVNAADRHGNGEWTLLSMTPTVNHYYSGDGRNWAEVTYVVRLKRQPIYYTCVLLMPTFLSATICLLGLFVPASSKGERIEKVNMGLATLLSMAMILGIVAEEMPKTTTLPLLANQFDVYEAITTGYNKNVFPVKNVSAPMVVSVELTYFGLLNMDQKQETITFVAVVDMIWKDENIGWNASEFGNISSVLIPYSLLWKPDIIVPTGQNFEYMIPDDQRFASVRSDGAGNGEWTLVSFDKLLYSYTATDGQPYAAVDYTVTLRRQPTYYICVMLIPTFVTATICLFGLFVPAMNTGERVEKVNMGLATLLSMAVILGIVAGEMPKATTLPLLGFYVLAELILCTIGVIVSMVIAASDFKNFALLWLTIGVNAAVLKYEVL
uniref:Neurotransmitter-gated ion-channel ligand-binding domain-containing protein n=1 Tax=Plectus sambesii TaxID=2011161 RepID=A0A914UY62_9BILA